MGDTKHLQRSNRTSFDRPKVIEFGTGIAPACEERPIPIPGEVVAGVGPANNPRHRFSRPDAGDVRLHRTTHTNSARL